MALFLAQQRALLQRERYVAQLLVQLERRPRVVPAAVVRGTDGERLDEREAPPREPVPDEPPQRRAVPHRAPRHVGSARRRRERDLSRLPLVEPFQLNPVARPLPRWARATLAVMNVLGLSAAAFILYWVIVRGAAFYLFGVRL